MIETLKRHPMIGGILLIVAIVGGLAGFIEDLGELWDKFTKDRIIVETPHPQSFVQRNLLKLSAEVPVEWVINRGHIESWLYVTPPNSEFDEFELGKAETGSGKFPYIFEHYKRLPDEEYDQIVPPKDLGLTDFKPISIMAEVFLGEGSWADRYSYKTKYYYIEKVSFIDYYHGSEEEPYLLELMCVVPISAEDRFKSSCSRVIGSTTIQ